MHVGARDLRLAAHHHRDLGVGLQVDEAVDHLHAGALEVARPADVGLLVEARLELDQRRHRLAGLGRLDQLLDDRRIVAGAVERLLDRHHRRIARRLAQELHDDVEALVGMMDDDVLGADGGEAVAAEVADALGKAHGIGLELEIRPLVDDQRLHVADVEHAVEMEHVTVGVCAGISSWSNRKSRSSAGMAELTEIEIRSPRRRRFSALS